MNLNFSKALAFILEGPTEKIFYLQMIDFFCRSHPGSKLQKNIDDNSGEIYYTVSTEKESVLIKLNVVGTVSQMTNSAAWFFNRCIGMHKYVDWSVFLCYDTDSYQDNVSKFYEGDWKRLRNNIERSHCRKIVDLAAKADIEDTMLLDSYSIFRYLEMEPVAIPLANKGKTKMKKIFRLKGQGVAYHEGERAFDLIRSLNMQTIIDNSPIPFAEIEKSIFM